jgi:hypothetical protein
MNGRAKYISLEIVRGVEAWGIVQFQEQVLQQVFGNVGAQGQPRQQCVQLRSLRLQDR